MMSEDQIKAIEDWDPDEARKQLEGKQLKMPVVFKREEMEFPNMTIVIEEPRPAVIEQTKPKVINTKKNKNSLF